MINDKIRSEAEQGTAAMVEMLGLFFRSLISDGFTESQALTLTCRYMSELFSSGRNKPSE